MHLELVHGQHVPERSPRPPVPRKPLPGHRLPPGPVTRDELEARWDAATIRRHYAPLWRGMYRRRDQADDLALRTRALARQFPGGVLCGRSAALLWGDDSQDGRVPEICVAERRSSPAGRRVRYGTVPEQAVVVRDGLAVTSLLRTCLDLAHRIKDRPNGYGRPEDLVVSLDRLSAAHPELPETLRALLAHPSSAAPSVTSAASRGRLAWALARSEAASPSAAASRARLLLHDAGLTGFHHGHAIGAGRGAARPALADPDARVLVEFAGAGHRRLPAEPGSPRAAGWTTVVAYEGPRGDRTPRPDEPCAYDPVAASDAALRTARTLRERWRDVEIHLPLDHRACVLDPSGFWDPGDGHDAPGGDYLSGADGSAW